MRIRVIKRSYMHASTLSRVRACTHIDTHTHARAQRDEIFYTVLQPNDTLQEDENENDAPLANPRQGLLWPATPPAPPSLPPSRPLTCGCLSSFVLSTDLEPDTGGEEGSAVASFSCDSFASAGLKMAF